MAEALSLPLPLPRMEEAALNAAPYLQQLIYDGWLLRFSEGQTGRANSVNVLQPSTLPLATKFAWCEEWYRLKSLPCRFRVTSISPEVGLDDALAHAGYDLATPTSTLWMPLDAVPLTDDAATGIEFSSYPLAEWLHHLHSFKGEDAAAIERHQRRLQTLVPRGEFVVLKEHGRVVSVGSTYFEGEFAGVFNVATATDARGRGHGRRLMQGLLRTMRRGGARYAYLQVSEENTPALALYRSLGFATAYRYWYRVKP